MSAENNVPRYMVFLPVVVNVVLVVYFYGRQTVTLETMAATITEIRQNARVAESRLRDIELSLARKGITHETSK